MKTDQVKSEWSFSMGINRCQIYRCIIVYRWPSTLDLNNVNSPVKVNTSHTKNKYHEEGMINGEAGNICKQIDSADK